MIDKFIYGFIDRVYGASDYTQQEINAKLIQKMDEVIENCNNAFEFVDWLKKQGVPDEVQNIINTMLEDGTIDELINVSKFNNLKNEVNSKIESIIKYDVTQNSLFDVNDVSKAINDIVGKLKENDSVFLPNITCKFKNTINLTNIPAGVTIDFRGNLIQDGELTEAIRFTGKNATLKFNKLTGNSATTNGLVLGGNGACFNNTIDFSQISSFNYGVYLNPLNKNGVQYNKINFDNVEKCNTCIMFDCIAESWVNENTFYGGSLGDWEKVAQYGVKFINGNKTTDIGYNNNKFYNVGFEGLSKDAVTLHNSPWNSFINCRMLESLNGKYIVDDNTSSGNKFIFSAILPIEKIELVSNLSSYDGPLMAGTGQAYRYSGFIVDKNGKRRYKTINGEYTSATTSDMKIIDSTITNLEITSVNNEINIKIS